MGITFYAERKEGNQWQRIKGLVFPLSYADYLDERLDECYLTIFRDTTPTYYPMEEIRVCINEEEQTTYRYYIVSQDESIEHPVGANPTTYKHKLHLLELTKHLEGIMCQSITFTNAKGAVYTNSTNPVFATSIIQYVDYIVETKNELIEHTHQLITPIKKNEEHVFPTVANIAKPLIDYINNTALGANIVLLDSAKIVVDGEKKEYLPSVRIGDSIEYGNNKNLRSIVNDDVVQIEYMVVYENQSVPCLWKIQYTIYAVTNHAPLPKWTIKTCIDRVLEIAEPLFGNETPRYALDPDQAERLDAIPAPEFTMTQCNLREQLHMIGGYIHAEPRLIYKEDGKKYVHFDFLGEMGDAVLPEKAKRVATMRTISINNYQTELITNAQNLVHSGDDGDSAITEPNDAMPGTIRTDSINVRITEANGYAQTLLPIQSIKKVECGVYKEDGTLADGKLYDITPYVFERAEYDGVLSSYDGGYPYSKAYALYYTQGQRNIYGLFFKTAEGAQSDARKTYAIRNILDAVTGNSQNIKSVWSTMFDQNVEAMNAPLLAFRISYVPIFSTMFSHGKPFPRIGAMPYQVPYNQSENLIDTRYYGENIKGVAARIGNVDETRTYLVKSPSRVPGIGQELDGMVISAVQVEALPDYCKCTLSLTKDYNRISQFIGINSQKRVFEVSEKEAYRRNILLKEYIVVDGNEEKPTSEMAILYNAQFLKSIFKPTDGGMVTAVRGTFSDEGENGGKVEHAKALLPVVSCAMGNAMVFSWAYKDNYSAGTQVEQKTSGDIKGYWQKDMPYCGYYGRAKYYNFTLVSKYGDTIPTGNNAMMLPQDFMYSGFKECAGTTTTNNPYKNYLVSKDSRETPYFTYEVETVSDDERIIIGSAFTSRCSLVNRRSASDIGDAVIYTLNKKIGKFTSKVDACAVINTIKPTWEEDNIFSTYPTAFSIKFDGMLDAPNGNSVKAWVIATRDGDIILACNDPSISRINFSIRHNIYS